MGTRGRGDVAKRPRHYWCPNSANARLSSRCVQLAKSETPADPIHPLCATWSLIPSITSNASLLRKQDTFMVSLFKIVASSECQWWGNLLARLSNSSWWNCPVRLKIKCNRKWPCASCVKWGCPSICPNGALTQGKNKRYMCKSERWRWKRRQGKRTKGHLRG